ncbi:MAG: glycosyltransferase [Sedimentisphaerales bacterium]|nr:glycosyltransferase [Sedimentisphaerales bacterium]
MAPNISVCIPTYNREFLLKETLDSVFVQTYKDFEVVIVDDGSTDGTRKMLEDNGYNVRYYWQENAGDAAARNKLIELAKGKYISFLDSDDLLYPDALEKMIKAMPDGADDVIVYGPYVAIDENGDILRRRKRKLYSGRITRYLFENILIHSCGSLFPNRMLVGEGGFDASLPVCSDYDLWLRLSMKYDFIGLQEPVFKRRRHSGNISQLSFVNRNTEYKVLENFYFNKGGKDIIPGNLAMRRLSKEQYRAARSAIRESKEKEACELLKDSLRRHFNLKSFCWLLLAQNRLHPALRTGEKDIAGRQQLAVKKARSISDIKIAIDFNPVLVNRFSGFYTFGTGILEGFAKLKEKPEMILFHSGRFASRAEEVVKYELRGITEQKTLTVKMRWLENFWNHFDYPKLESLTGDFDIYHCFHHLMPPTKTKPRLMTVYDLRRYKLPRLYKRSKLGFFESAVKRADHFLAISESTKEDLCSVFGIKTEKVDIVPLAPGIDPVFYSAGEQEEIKDRLSSAIGEKLDNFLVVISSPDSRKNIPRIVEAFEGCRYLLDGDMKLVVVGQLAKREREFSRKLKAGFYNNVVWAGIVDDLRLWLGCAQGFIFASLYEGFGIPILEAFACGAPVITSNCSSMPEVAGEAALYVDPFSTESISEAIVKISTDKDLVQRLIKAGRERNKLFTWERTAGEVVKVYRKLANI